MSPPKIRPRTLRCVPVRLGLFIFCFSRRLLLPSSVPLLASRSVSGGDCVEAPAAPRSPSRRKISEDLESTPSPHKAGVQRNISMPKPMKL